MTYQSLDVVECICVCVCMCSLRKNIEEEYRLCYSFCKKKKKDHI